MTDLPANQALSLKHLLIETSPLIEAYTAALCPTCTDVCCRQKHGLYQARDRSYLSALGITVPERDASKPLDGPCESMGPLGCLLPRWMRPFKCTWYYCKRLLIALDESPQKKVRFLNRRMQEMIDLYALLHNQESQNPVENGS